MSMMENLQESAQLQPEAEQPLPPTGAAKWQRIVRSLWSAAGSPWLVLALSLALALLLALTWLIPQLPGQSGGEAGAAERWLAVAAANWGGFGSLLRSLGLFQILHSPLLQLLFSLLSFVLLVQLARLIWAAITLRRTPPALDTAGGVNGEPLPVAAAGALLRWRHSHSAQPLALAGELQRLLEARLPHVERRTVRVVAAPLHADKDGEASSAGNSLTKTPTDNTGKPDTEIVLEERLLAMRGLNAVWLRPLLVLGMLAALALIWLNAIFGWEFAAQQLAPGERTAAAQHDLRFEYHIEQSAANLLQPSLIATVDGETVKILMQQEMQEQVGSAVVRGQPGEPGLFVQTADGRPLLARPGQVTPVSTIGLSFPSAGSEETVLLPQQAIGLRIVRMEEGRAGPAEDVFLLEVFQGGNEQAVERTTVDHSDVVDIPTFTGPITLVVTPMPALSIQVRHSPGHWLLWPALALLALGALGFWQQPGFVLAQLGPWPPQRTVITLQSDLPGEMASLRRWYGERQSDRQNDRPVQQMHKGMPSIQPGAQTEGKDV